MKNSIIQNIIYNAGKNSQEKDISTWPLPQNHTSDS